MAEQTPDPNPSNEPGQAIDLEPSLFRTRMSFNIATIAVILILAVIYGFLA